MGAIETFPSLADIDAIGACPHPVLRNLRITQAYHELSTAMAPFTPEQLGVIAEGRTPDGTL